MGAVDPKYLAGVRARLDELLGDDQVEVEDYDPDRDRIVIFSDHHRGTGDSADDFRRSEHAYTAALGYYLEAGYRLLLLGDVEELWEVVRPAKIFEQYRELMELERGFAGAGGLERFWGNHDDRWAKPAVVDRELGELLGGAPMREALKLRIERPGGEPVIALLVHGHQGTANSGWRGLLARLPVRYIWPHIQRLFGATATTPATDHGLRSKHDRAMFAWASEDSHRILIAGHTHRPVFAESRPPSPVTRPTAELEQALAAAREALDRGGAALLASELEYARTLERREELPLEVKPPCYFNTGCCSFPDGDITGIELADREIRLVRWPANLGELRPPGGGGLEAERRVLARESLDWVVEAVANPTAEPMIVERQMLPGESGSEPRP